MNDAFNREGAVVRSASNSVPPSPLGASSVRRVLHVMGGGMNRGGAETLVMNIYRNLDPSKVQFDFVVHTQTRGHFDAEIQELGGRIFHCPRYEGRNHLAYHRWWAQFFSQHPEYRIIHGHVRSTAAIYLRIAKKYGLITIAHSHNTSSGGGVAALMKNVLQYRIPNIADHLFACSPDAALWLFGRQGASRAHLINNAIDLPAFAFAADVREEVRSELGLTTELVIGHVGRFHPQKNHLFLLDIASVLVREGRDVVLLLVGDGALRAEIERRSTELALTDRVHLLGIRSDTSRLMQAMDIMVLPSLHEGFPVVLVEAQAAGLPCLVSDSITKTVALTDLVQFVPLESGAELWASRIKGFVPIGSRSNTSVAIAESGFDSQRVSCWMTDFYRGLITSPASTAAVR